MYLIKHPKTFKQKMHAVSPVVATLVLIVVAIVGAIAVGLIMSRVASDTSSQANVGNVSSGAQTTLLIGGSTTIYPVTQAAIPSFEAKYSVNVIDAQGGSGAGMQGVISGAIDIGAASSSSAVYQAQTYIVDNSITGVTLDPTLIGGSGVVFISNLASDHGAFLTDGTTACPEISAAAINEMYLLGTFYIQDGVCGGFTAGAAAPALDFFPQNGAGYSTTSITVAAGQLLYGGTAAGPAGVPAAEDIIGGSGVAPAGYTGPYQSFGRSDNSGTQDTVTGWLTGSTVSNYPYGASTGETGNPGLLSAIQKCSATSGAATVAGCIGFVDLGFAEGAVAGTACQSGWVASSPCGVDIVEPSTSNTAPDTLQNAATVKGNGYVLAVGSTVQTGSQAGTSTADLHAFILTALQNYATINPLNTANPSTNVYPDSGGSLARSFYYVTNGTPTPVEQDWLNFITSPDPSSQAFFNNNGYFTIYQMSGA